MFGKIHSVYFLGIGGIGMSALARFFLAKGCAVYGYDRTETALTKQLITEGARIDYIDSVDNLPDDFKTNSEATLVVYTPAIPLSNTILQYFKANNVDLLKRSEILGRITKDYFTIAIAGTHGKTTTSTMVAHVLNECGINCIAFLGGISQNFGSNLLLNDQAEVIVVEADEFDRSFLTLSPNIALLSSIEPDHLDIYGEEEAMVESYQMFVDKLEKEGVLITKPEILKRIRCNKSVTFGLNDGCDVYASEVEVKEARYNISVNKGSVFKLGLPGIHNVENALGTYAIARQLNVDDSMIRQALSTFKGVKRRFEYHIDLPDFVYIDDYAHHPSELNYCIQSVRELYPNKKITGIFQPHLYSRTRDFMVEFAKSLSLLDELILLDIYPARELPIEGITSASLLEKVDLSEKKLLKKESVITELKLTKPEVLITMGAGDIDLLVDPIKETFAQMLQNN